MKRPIATAMGTLAPDGWRRQSYQPSARLRVLAIALFSSAALVMMSPSAQAVEPEVISYEVMPRSTQAGGHPDLRLRVKVAWQECTPEGCLNPRNFESFMPTGYIANPHVIPQCTLTELNTASCPSDSQVGVLDIGPPIEPGISLVGPIYNMETGPEQAGLLGYWTPLAATPGFFEVSGRTDSDYGLNIHGTPLLNIPIKGVHTYLWGVPADPIHDSMRFVTPMKGFGACFEFAAEPPPWGEFPHCETAGDELGAASAIPPLPYLQNPVTCGVALTAGFRVLYFDRREATAQTAFPAMTGCQQMSFDPALTVKPTTKQADSPAGLDFQLRVPQPQSPDTAAASEILKSTMTLPRGFSINPGAADGKVACRDADTAIGTVFAATCPENAKIGTLSLDVAALPGPIPGAMYLAEPKPGDPYPILLTANGFATHVKLFGSVRPDPQTGQVTIEFDDLPQSPLQEFNIHGFGSERGLFATPTHCGTYPLHAEFVPWNDELTTRKSTGSVSIDTGPNGTPCPNGPRPLDAALSAGSENATAGEHAPFSLSLSREDGEQNLAGLDVTTPPGFVASLKGIPYCPESAIALLSGAGYPGATELASPACSPSSQVGTVVVGAGAGSHPVYTSGKVYLAGPYRGAPLSLVVVIPALSGPYDLGAVAVRVAVHVDPVTAQVATVSDPFPQILAGVLLRTRSVLVDLDRPNFALNPTNCDPLSVDVTAIGDEGALSHQRAHYQVANCASLAYGPKLRLRLKGGVRRRGHPAIHAVLTARRGEANTRRVTVTLPKGELLDNSHIRTICSRSTFAREACPAASRIGTAQAFTPLLDDTLRGSVYLRSSSHRLPDMVVDLRGQIDVILVGKIDSVRGRLRTTFTTLPDAPIDRFVLDLLGGAKGLLTNSESLCSASKNATVRMLGQNDAAVRSSAKLQVACGPVKSRRKHRRSRMTRLSRAGTVR